MTSVLSGCGFTTSTATVIDRAHRNFAAHHYRAAAVDLQNVITQRPEDAALRLELAQALLHVGRYGEAEAAFRRAEKLGVPTAEVLPGLAEALIDEGEAQQALDELAKPSSAALTNQAVVDSIRGRAFLALDKLDDAQPALARAVAADPHDTLAHVALAALLQRRGDASGAKSELDRLIAAAPTDFSAHLALGTWYLEENHTREAKDELIRALDLALAGIRAGSEPPFDETRTLAVLAETDLQAGDIKDAHERVERLRKLAPKARGTSLLRARVDLRENHPEEARTVLEELLGRNPDDEPVMVLLATADAASGHLEQADMNLTSALAKAPTDLEARKLLAKVELDEHRPKDALRTATDPNAALDADLLALASRASAESGDPAGAKAYLEQSEKTAPRDKVRALQLAAADLADNRPADAAKLLQSLQVPDALAVRREGLLLIALSRTGASAADLQSEAKRFAAARSSDEASLLLAARALASTKDADGALSLLDQAARAAPTSPRPWIARAVLEGSRGDQRAAKSAFERALQIDPRSIAALLEETRFFMASGDRASAALSLAKARTLAPDDANVLLLSGAVALSEGNGRDAIGIFEQLTTRFPKSAVLYADLARAYVLAGRLTEARGASADAVKVGSGYWPALVLDASLALDAKDLDRVAQNLSQLQGMKAPPTVIQMLQGDLATAKGNLAEALNDYTAAARTAPSALLAEKMTRVRYQLHQADPAAPMKDWLERSPHDAHTRLVLAQFLQATGDVGGATRAYEAILADAPQDLIALNNLAWIRLSAGNTPAGLTLAHKAYTIAPSQPAVADTYGWALLQSGKAADALAILRSAHDAAPRDPEIHLHLATALLKTGDRAAAQSELRKIIEGEPKAPQAEQARSMLAGR